MPPSLSGWRTSERVSRVHFSRVLTTALHTLPSLFGTTMADEFFMLSRINPFPITGHIFYHATLVCIDSPSAIMCRSPHPYILCGVHVRPYTVIETGWGKPGTERRAFKLA